MSVVNLESFTAEIPKRFASCAVEKRNWIGNMRLFDDWIRNHLCGASAMRTSENF